MRGHHHAFSAVEVIGKKREGKALTEEEILAFVNGYVAGDIPDYQCAAFLMAVSSLRCTFLGASSLARSAESATMAARELMPFSMNAFAVGKASVASMLALKRNSRTSPSAALAILCV